MREPVSGLLHALGVVFGVVGLFFLVDKALSKNSLPVLYSYVVFGLSLIGLFLSSTLYHLLRVSPQNIRRLRILDHMMIFVFIAGTYTPICVIVLNGVLGWTLLGAVWSIALLGFVMKIFWMDAPRWLYTLLYVLMGWLSMFVIYPLYQALPSQGLAWLIGGGLFYTVGAVVYAAKWPDPLPLKFGFHEIWHIFVMLGALAHFWTIYHYV